MQIKNTHAREDLYIIWRNKLQLPLASADRRCVDRLVCRCFLSLIRVAFISRGKKRLVPVAFCLGRVINPGYFSNCLASLCRRPSRLPSLRFLSGPCNSLTGPEQKGTQTARGGWGNLNLCAGPQFKTQARFNAVRERA